MSDLRRRKIEQRIATAQGLMARHSRKDGDSALAWEARRDYNALRVEKLLHEVLHEQPRLTDVQLDYLAGILTEARTPLLNMGSEWKSGCAQW